MSVNPILTLAVCLCALAGPALAQEESAPSWTVDGTIGVVSDYRYRGYSLSDDAPAAQTGVTVSHASGAYADVYLSTIDEYGLDEAGDGAEIEATLTLGWAGPIAGLDVDAAVATYQYPGGVDVAYYEIPVQVGQTRGIWTWSLGTAWAPSGQTALGDEDNRYLWGGLEAAPAAWPISVHGTVGFEDGAYAPDGKTDWTIGLSLPIGSAVLGADYVDSDAADGVLVASVFYAF